MDMYCTTCGEPWDTDTLHEVISERMMDGSLPLVKFPGVTHGEEYKAYRATYDSNYDIVRNDFYRKGCKAMTGYTSSWCERRNNEQSHVMSALIDIMGDDLDGIACAMEDAGY
jgi:hypothetical protein